MTTRAEHLAWCKLRAIEYLDSGDVTDAVASMGSDMTKHPEIMVPAPLMQLGLLYAMNHDSEGVRRWIEGFN